MDYEERPWGSFETLGQGDGYKVKKLVVNPGGQLSLQYHKHRAETWVIIEGEAYVRVEGEVDSLLPGSRVAIEELEIHRLENRGLVPLVVIEVQTGSYLGEDDIVRFEDQYGRS